MKCPNCYKEIKDSSKFCRYCGAKIETQQKKVRCPQCGFLNRAEAVFCDNCGAKLGVGETPKVNQEPKTASHEELKKTEGTKKTTEIKNKDVKTTKHKTDSSNQKSSNAKPALIIFFAFLILILLIFSGTNHADPIEISSVKLVDTYKLSIDTSDGRDYADDEMLVKEYKIKFKALTDVDNFRLTSENLQAVDNDGITTDGIYFLKITKNKHGGEDYNYQNSYLFKPKKLKEGKTYKYTLKVCTYPQERNSKDNWKLDQLEFDAYDDDGDSHLYYDNIKN